MGSSAVCSGPERVKEPDHPREPTLRDQGASALLEQKMEAVACGSFHERGATQNMVRICALLEEEKRVCVTLRAVFLPSSKTCGVCEPPLGPASERCA